MAKVEEYQQMMAWLTRPKSKFQEPRNMNQGGRIGFEPGGSALKKAGFDPDRLLSEMTDDEKYNFKKYLNEQAKQKRAQELTEKYNLPKQKLEGVLKDYTTYGEESLDALTESMFEGKKYFELGTKDKTAVKRKFRNKLKDLAEGKIRMNWYDDRYGILKIDEESQFKSLYNEALNNHPNVRGRDLDQIPEGKLTQAKTMAAEEALSKLPKETRKKIVDNAPITLRDVDTTGGIPRFKSQELADNFLRDVTKFYELPRGTGGGEFSYAREAGLSIKDLQKKYFPDLGTKRVEQLVTNMKNTYNLPDHPSIKEYEKIYGRGGKKEKTPSQLIRDKLDPEGIKGSKINPLKRGSGFDIAHSLKAGILDPDKPGPQLKKETADTLYPLKQELNRERIALSKHTAAENALTKIHNDRMKLMEQVEGDNFRVIPGKEREFAELQAKGKKIAREFSYTDELFGTKFKGLPGKQKQVRGTVNFQIFNPDEKGIYKPENTTLVGGDTEKSLAKGLRKTEIAKKDIKKLTKPELKKFTANAIQIFKDNGILCTKGVGGQCNSIADYRKSFNELVEKAAAGDKPAVSKMNKFIKGMRKVKGAAKWTGYGLLAEAGFMLPFAVGDYAAGKKWSRIIGNATDYGFGPIFGQSEQEEFEAALTPGSAAPQAENVMELGEKLTKMEQQKVNPGYGRVGYRKRAEDARQNVYDDTLDQYLLNIQPFIRPNPQLEAGQFYDQGLMDKAMQEGAAAKEKIRQEDLIRKQQRDIGMPMDFMAAGGGIASIRRPNAIPPESGPTPQGLPSMYNRVKRI